MRVQLLIYTNYTSKYHFRMQVDFDVVCASGYGMGEFLVKELFFAVIGRSRNTDRAFRHPVIPYDRSVDRSVPFYHLFVVEREPLFVDPIELIQQFDYGAIRTDVCPTDDDRA